MQEFDEETIKRGNKVWQARLIIGCMLIIAEIVLPCILIKGPILAAAILAAGASGTLVGFTAFLVLAVRSDYFGEAAGYFFGFATAILVFFGKAGMYIGLAIGSTIVVLTILFFQIAAASHHRSRRS